MRVGSPEEHGLLFGSECVEIRQRLGAHHGGSPMKDEQRPLPWVGGPEERSEYEVQQGLLRQTDPSPLRRNHTPSRVPSGVDGEGASSCQVRSGSYVSLEGVVYNVQWTECGTLPGVHRQASRIEWVLPLAGGLHFPGHGLYHLHPQEQKRDF